MLGASLRSGALPARTLSAERPGAIPAPAPPPFAPSLAWRPCRSCSLALAISPALGRGAWVRACARAASSPQGGARYPCARLAVGRIPAPASALRRRPGPCPGAVPPPALALGGRGWVPSRPCRPLPAGAAAAPCGGGLGGSWVRWCFLGVSCGRFLVRSFRFRRAAFRAVWLGSLGGLRPGRFLPPLGARPVWRRGGGSVLVGAGRRRVRPLVVAPLAARLPWLRRPPGSRRRGRCALVVRVGSGRAAARSRSPGWCVAPPGRRVRRPLRGCRVVSPLVVFVAGLPPGVAPWSPWPPRPGVLLVACPSRCVALAACRRAAALGLAVAGPLTVSRRRWLVAVRWVPRPPSALAVRFGADPPALSAPPSLPGVPLPFPPCGGGRSRSVAPPRPGRVSFAQGRLF